MKGTGEGTGCRHQEDQNREMGGSALFSIDGHARHPRRLVSKRIGPPIPNAYDLIVPLPCNRRRRGSAPGPERYCLGWSFCERQAARAANCDKPAADAISLVMCLEF